MDEKLSTRKTQELRQLDTVDWESIRKILQETAGFLETEHVAMQDIVLHRRSEQVSAPPARRLVPEDYIASLTFRLGGERYAVPVERVQTVAEIRSLTPVPCVPDFYRGVINLNGKIVTVLDILRLFGVSQTETTGNKVVVVSGAGLEIALLVDEIESVAELPRQKFTKSQVLGPEWLGAVEAVASDGRILLDIEELLRDPRIRIYEEA